MISRNQFLRVAVAIAIASIAAAAGCTAKRETHPDPEKRIEAIKELIQSMEGEDKTGKVTDDEGNSETAD